MSGRILIALRMGFTYSDRVPGSVARGGVTLASLPPFPMLSKNSGEYHRKTSKELVDVTIKNWEGDLDVNLTVAKVIKCDSATTYSGKTVATWPVDYVEIAEDALPGGN